MICQVCDQPDYQLVIHDTALHRRCAPGYWLKGYDEHKEFMGKVRQLGKARYSQWKAWKT